MRTEEHLTTDSFERHAETAAPAWFRLPSDMAGEMEALWALNREMVAAAVGLREALAKVATMHADLLAGLDTAHRHATATGARLEPDGALLTVLQRLVGYDGDATRALADLLWDASVFPTLRAG